MGEHGTAASALDVLPEIARVAGVKDYVPFAYEAAREELRRGHKFGARLIAKGDADYPALLAEIEDAPPLLWTKGNSAVLKKPRISLVGARNASALGMRMARFLSADIAAQGIATVSGLARGIDTAVHETTMKTGTIAVFGGGLDHLYPSENKNLARAILENGLHISEQPFGMAPQARHFPMRNRIISALSPALIVIEAAAKSGSLITARTALDQGREVLAVPGHPFDARASGCNMLIRDGATLVRNAEDAIAALPPQRVERETPEETPPPPKRNLRETAALHQQILDRLGPSPIAEDQLIRELGVAAAPCASALVELELEGQVERLSGGMIARHENTH
jgi:DNA processing protein